VENRELEIRELDGGRVALSVRCEGRIETALDEEPLHS